MPSAAAITVVCDAQSLCRAAAALCAAGEPLVDKWMRVLPPEDRVTCTALYNLVTGSSLMKAGDPTGTSSSSTSNGKKAPATDEALGDAVTQVLEGFDSQLSNTRETLIKAFSNMEMSVLDKMDTRMRELECDLKKACLTGVGAPRQDATSVPLTTASPEPQQQPEPKDSPAVGPPPAAIIRRKSCIKVPKEFKDEGTAESTASHRACSSKDPRLSLTQPAGKADAEGAIAMSRADSMQSSACGLVKHFQDEPTIHYRVAGYKLGAGTFGTTRVGHHKDTGHERAIKSIPKALMDSAEVWKEIRVMCELDHPNIVRLYATYEDSKTSYLVMELCSGGELFDAIVESREGLSEKVAARLMRQMLAAVNYLHVTHKICHRDLKPENFLLSRKADDDEKVVKLIDFGSAKSFSNGEELTTKVFTVHYVAPEILTRHMKPYTEVCDVWSLGVILFLLLAGRPPFSGEDDMTIMKAIKKGRYAMEPESVWCHVSADAVELMTGMLEVNPAKRHSSTAASNHRWIEELAPDALAGVALASDAVLGGLKSFMAQNKLKKCALQVIAQSISDEHMDALKSAFLVLDKDKHGSLRVDEIQTAIQGLRLEAAAESDLKHVLEDMAKVGDGQVNYSQFLGAAVDRKQYMQETALREVFNCFDADGDGSISKEELAAVLGRGSTDSGSLALSAEAKQALAADASELEAILESVDKDGDGNIDFKEFMAMMSNGTVDAT